MSQYLCITNDGLLDPRLITLFGANVKPNSTSPIGFFGTGLKYAIAVTLRLGGEIHICIDGNTWLQFHVENQSIRDKSFPVVQMTTINHGPMSSTSSVVSLPFTTELGKTWEPWMAYRELWCNALDEQNAKVDIFENNDLATMRGKLDQTTIYVDCPPILQAHIQRHKYFLQSTPLWSNEELEIHQNTSASPAIYYKGIYVGDLPQPSLWTYNIKYKLPLTEERKYSSLWDIQYIIGRNLPSCSDPAILNSVFLAGEDSFERDVSFYGVDNSAPPTFKQTLTQVGRARRTDLTPASRALFKRLSPEDNLPRAMELDHQDRATLDHALRFLARAGHPISAPVIITETLGHNILGTAIMGQIYITEACVQQGTVVLVATLLEEQLHITHGFDDCTREMQNFLLNGWVAEMMKRVGGE